VSLLLTRDALLGRRSIAGGSLASLTKGLRSELEPLVRGSHAVPAGKALLTREGGRCSCDGALLPYQPFDERHRCPRCARELTGERHDRFRLYWHHLWLAERSVHAAMLGVLLDDASCRATAIDLLGGYATQYLAYPNVDNVLGPSRPFFSTYLESIWLLQLCTALDLLELGAPGDAVAALGARVRDELIAPSAALIASYDEGMSNRQVWNNAALLAAGAMLGDAAMRERALYGRSGVCAHLEIALLRDGSWYEGENYHLFAHRGLWYALQMAGTAGDEVAPALTQRFDAGFIAPLRTVLPDLTYPSRRDSQYAISIRQMRVAESCELGIARRMDERLLGWLARLYDPAIRRGETGRATTSADVERNLPATGLSRSDLSWRTLLLGVEKLPVLKALPLDSDLLPAQGVGILRRDGGGVYVALDYGHSGGGHGHPDRLNLLLVDGHRRWFDDPGTGSYVDDSLHWYRSTLAHSAPLVDGRSQPRVDGTLLAFADDGRAGWMSAGAELAPGLRVRRSIVVMENYLIDELEWDSTETHEIALPLHGVDLVGTDGVPVSREAGSIDESVTREDGFGYLEETMRCTAPAGTAQLLGDSRPGEKHRLRGWLFTGRGTTWWSASAPRAPGLGGRERLLLVRRRATSGRVVGIWAWRDGVADVERAGETLVVTLRAGDRHVHRRTDIGWRVETADRLGARRSVDLAGPRAPSIGPRSLLEDELPDPGEDASEAVSPLALPMSAELGEPHYRQSEAGWAEAGAPVAHVTVSRTGQTVSFDIRVEPSGRRFVAPDSENVFDNEPPGINGDGVQLYVVAGEATGGWLFVPVAARNEVGVHPAEGWSGGLVAEPRWHATEHGYAMHIEVAVGEGLDMFEADVVVNEIGDERARRRGQLILSGGAGEFVYLRGDRHEAARLLRFSLTDV